jgi:hypothetical protein
VKSSEIQSFSFITVTEFKPMLTKIFNAHPKTSKELKKTLKIQITKKNDAPSLAYLRLHFD